MMFCHSKALTACLTLAVFFLSVVPAKAEAAAGRGAEIKPPWKHADKSLPRIPLPRIEGERYEAEVPDTLDLSHRAALAIHGITEMLDPETDYLMFDHAWFNRRPPVMTITMAEEILSCGNKHLKALPLLRLMSGSTFNLEVFRVIDRTPYKLTIKGNTVIDIDPEGKINPIYQRDSYKQDKAPIRKVTRFVSEETLIW